jgi:hypothetical protein
MKILLNENQVKTLLKTIIEKKDKNKHPKINQKNSERQKQ